MQVSDDGDQLIISTAQTLKNIDIRIIKELLMQGDWDESLVEGLGKMEAIVGKLNLGVEKVCSWWNEFFKKYKINMGVLKEMYTQSERENPICTDILNFLDGTDSLVPHHFMKFLMKELFNTKILMSLDEKADTFNHNIQNELQDNLIP